MLSEETEFGLRQTLYSPQHQPQYPSKLIVSNADDNLGADESKTSRKNRTKFNPFQVHFDIQWYKMMIIKWWRKGLYENKGVHISLWRKKYLQTATLEALFQRNDRLNFRKMIPTIAKVGPCHICLIFICELQKNYSHNCKGRSMSYLYLNFRKIAKFVPSYIHPLVNTNSSRLAYSTESSFHPLVFVSWVGGCISWQISNLQIWKNTAVVFYDKYQSCNTAGKYLLLTVDFTQEIGEGADTVRVWFKNRWSHGVGSSLKYLNLEASLKYLDLGASLKYLNLGAGSSLKYLNLEEGSSLKYLNPKTSLKYFEISRHIQIFVYSKKILTRNAKEGKTSPPPGADSDQKVRCALLQ